MKTKQVVYASLIAALIFVCLMLINIKTSTDIISFAYVVVFATAILFDNKTAGLGCGIGAALFDTLGGYINYAPFTFLAYGVMAYFIATFIKNNSSKSRIIIIGLMATLINIAVYFTANIIYFGLPFAISSIPIELINCAIGIAIGIPLAFSIKSLKIKKKH